MTYEAVVCKVMVASPSDVEKEHEIIDEIISEWNTINSESKRIILVPIRWVSHSRPEMGERPQGIINRQILKECDLLVAVFWTRFGTPTGKSPSGTAEEIEEHVKSGKPAMIYFSSVKVTPGYDQSQYNALLEFKEKCEARGLVENYASIDDFRGKFHRQLAQIVQDHICAKIEINKTNKEIISESIIRLSAEARELLIEAAKDKYGHIIRAEYMGGIDIETNERNFISDNTPRIIAIWEAALKELEDNQLIEPKSYKREIFSVTRKGYEVVEKLDSSLFAK